MLYEEAKKRIIDRVYPDFWMGEYDKYRSVMEKVDKNNIQVLTHSPGGEPVFLITYGKKEEVKSTANYNSAVAGRKPEAYMDKMSREKPVIFLLGPVHGQEVEGITGLVNFINILETGYDLDGNRRKEMESLAKKCRLVIIPVGNPDGYKRFKARSLKGLEEKDVQFWGQGTWSDNSLCGWPECKRVHPMTEDKSGFLGCYFNNEGINMMHDEFFDPMALETKAILDTVRKEGPDISVSLHSYSPPPGILRTSFVPYRVHEEIYEISKEFYSYLEEANYSHNILHEPKKEGEKFNLTSAIYHISGATSFTFECTEGLKDDYQVSFNDVLEIQLLLYKTMMEYCLKQKDI
ncbi:MAG: M14 family zinc carboxypeptidase [Bacillota bacterium]